MQYINHWPDMATLTIPEEVSQDLHQRLQEPFDSEQEAKEFWQEAPSTVIILDTADAINQLQESDTWNQIEFALTYQEYSLPLPLGYQLLLVAIANDSGGGIYLVVPPELTQIITER